MKWKIKPLILSSSAILSFSPFVATLSSCAKEINFDNLISEMKEDVISEFQWICPHYRETFHNLWFCDMLAARVKKMGFNPVYDTRTYKEGKYSPKQEEGEETAFGYNFYFDIPANDPKQQYKPIILQAHTDMVCTVKKGVAYDWSQGVVPVIETIGGKKVMHSKDNLTSLGADDGIGIASILCIAKHHNDFEHGLIRCLFTVDEEDGESGAKYIPNEWLNDFDYYLNLDGEDANLTWVSSAGAQQLSWTFDETEEIPTPEIGTRQFEIKIGGFMGGHSGLEIQNHPMNPMILTGEILQKLIDDTNYSDVRLVESFDNEKKTADPNGGTVPSKANFIIQTITTQTVEQLKTLIIERIKQAKQEPQQSGEDIEKLELSVEETTPSIVTLLPTTGLSTTSTQKLATLLSNYDSSRLYGSWEYIDDRPTVGSNVSAVRIGTDVKKADSNELYIEFFGRAESVESLDKFYKTDKEAGTENGIYKKAIATAFGSGSNTWKDIAYNPPWVKLEQNKLRELIHEAANSLDMIMLDDPCFGWLEPAEIYNKKPAMQLGALGPQLHNTHTIVETLDIDTIDNELRIVIYVIQNI